MTWSSGSSSARTRTTRNCWGEKADKAKCQALAGWSVPHHSGINLLPRDSCTPKASDPFFGLYPSVFAGLLGSYRSRGRPAQATDARFNPSGRLLGLPVVTHDSITMPGLDLLGPLVKAVIVPPATLGDLSSRTSHAFDDGSSSFTLRFTAFIQSDLSRPLPFYRARGASAIRIVLIRTGI